MSIEQKDVDRFWSKVNKQDETGCWEWTSTQTKDYGRIKINGNYRLTHRVSYELAKGPIPDGLTLDHLCRNRCCVNPDHLEPVTNKVNILRGECVSALNARKTHCKQGHEFTETNTYLFRNARGLIRHCRTCRAENDRHQKATNRSRINELKRIRYYARKTSNQV